MATTINAGVAKLRENLEVTALQSTTMSTRQQEVRDAVARGFTVWDSFLAGAYDRSTMIGPLKDADIDIIVVLSSEYWNRYTPGGLLNAVRDDLSETYTTTPKIRQDGQAVTLTFSDFKVDVTPAFSRQGAGYLIPNPPGGNWIETNPKAHSDLMTSQNKAHGGDLVPLVKMIKGWNRVINGVFKGFYLELLTTRILENITISSLSSGARYVFDKGREKIKFKQADPAGYGGYINALSGVNTVDEAISRFETAHARAQKAEGFAAKDDIPAAFEEWRKIFGDYFPAYG